MQKSVSRPLGLSVLAVVASLLALPSSGASGADNDPAITHAAKVNHLTEAQVRAKLRADHTLHVARSGHFYFADPAPAAVDSGPRLVPEPSAPLDQTFLLHSKAGSTHTIFLDFDGTDITGTEWNAEGLLSRHYSGWDISADGDTTFSAGERTVIQEVWRRVAEDYAPFDVDVTTADPGVAGLDRSSAGDQTFGARALFTQDSGAYSTVCPTGCGGLAFVGTFGLADSVSQPNDFFEPAWIFPDQLGGSDPEAMADAASHEIGHNLGLDHDGLNADEYLVTDGLWGPIMGAPYGTGVSQWSKGAYTGATNTQDDVAIIGSVVGTRTDEAPSTIAAAPLLGTGHGYISSRSDKDTYALGDCTGTVTLAATPAETGANLDIKLELLDAAGAVVASSNPVAQQTNWGVASGLDAAITQDLAAGADYVRVDGTSVGSGTTINGYDDYGSLGEYQITRTGGSCGTVAGTLPSAPTNVTAVADPTLPQVTVTWDAPTDPGTSAVTGYAVSVDGGATVSVGPAVRSTIVTGLTAGTAYTFRVAAMSDVGTGPSAPAGTTTAAAPTTAPSVPRSFTAAAHASLPWISLHWTPPADAGSSPVLGYRLAVNGTPVFDETEIPAGLTGVTLRGSYATTYTFALTAVSEDGVSTAAPATVTTAAKPATSTSISVPSRVRKGTRPTVKVTVAPVGTRSVPTGSVRLTVGGKSVTLTLRSGVATYKAPKQRKTGRVRVRAAYLGSGTFAVSSRSKTFRVR